ncbi:MAG: 3'-5' exonuclease [Alistipes sp.]|nr:3'-5' exonuclease [Alistipes sp.]
MSDYIQTLNDAQREAVTHYQEPSLIVAGAGSGKTRVLTCRIAYMLEQGVAPYHILALTFTNKAAAEMRERISALLSPHLTRQIWMGTFHSIFARILRAESEHLGYPSSYTIYDAADSRNLIKMLIREMNLNDENYKPNEIVSRISLAKNNLITPSAYEANASLLAEDRERRRPQFAELYKSYALRCHQNGAMDFDDLLLQTNILFRDYPEVLAKYQQQFHYILVDEYQDTNSAQYLIVKRLAERQAKVCVVGDDAQSIYSFRGAKIENILRFKNDFPAAKVFKLEQNYRSTQTIVNAANSIIEKNARQIRKHSFSTGEMGEKIRVIKAYTDKEEALMVANDIAATARATSGAYDAIAILYRTNAQSRALEEALRSRNIPYKIFGGLSFYQRKEIKDLVAYIRLVLNPQDDEAFRRIINTPARGIGDVTVGRIASAAAQQGISLWEAIHTLAPEQMDLRGAAGKKVTEFVATIVQLSALRGTASAHELGLEIALRSGIIGCYKMQQSPEATSALENIEELINSIRAYADEQERISNEAGESLQAPVTLDQWLQNVALLTDMDNDKPEERNKVTLMTVHGAKGLEFDHVYIAGMEENLFPSLMSLGTPEGLEEERRLFYVALTRAKQSAMLSFAESRFKWGEMTFSRPSRFLGEIDGRYLDLQFDESELETDSAEELNDAGPSFAIPRPRALRREGQGEEERTPKGRMPYQGAARTYYPERERSSREGATPKVQVPTPEGRFRRMGVRAVAEDSAPLQGAPEPQASQEIAGGLQVGMRVQHEKFGVGEITAIELWNGDQKLSVDFGAAGRKTLLRRIARLRILG